MRRPARRDLDRAAAVLSGQLVLSFAAVMEHKLQRALRWLCSERWEAAKAARRAARA